MLVAEGAVFNLSQTMDAAGLAGNPAATIVWGDGTQSAGTVSALPATGPLNVRFIFDLSGNALLNTQARKDLLQLAADSIVKRLNDDLAAIVPNPASFQEWSIAFDDPSTGQPRTVQNPTIAANEIVIYVGARNLPGDQRGLAGPGGFIFPAVNNITCTTQAQCDAIVAGIQSFRDTARARGEPGALTSPASDIGPWGGSIAFDNADTNWYFGTDPSQIQPGQVDFLTVATHELFHVFGFGNSIVGSSWNARVSGSGFTGPKSIAAFGAGGNVPLQAGDAGHWREGIINDGRETLMDPTIRSGRRTLPTPLDYAALDDIGWDVDTTRVTVNASHTYPDNGNYPIEIRLSSASGVLTSTASAVITNVAPTLTVVGNQTVQAGQPLALTNLGEITDPGFRNTSASPPTAETFTYTVNWGDNSAPTTGTATIDRHGSPGVLTLASFDAEHTYATPGNFTVQVTVLDDDNGSVQRSFSVQVTEPPSLSLVLSRSTIAENAGNNASVLTVTKSGPASTSPLTISLLSSDPSEATLPASVTLPAGQTSITVPINAVDDTLLDGTQTVSIDASASGVTGASIELLVTDVETIQAAFSPTSIAENAGPESILLTVMRSNTDTTQPLSVNVAGGRPNQFVIASPIVIPGGVQSVSLRLTPVDDEVAEANETLVLTFTAAGYTGTTASVTIIDDEPPKFQNPSNPFDVDGSGTPTAGDALAIINAINVRQGNPVLDPALEDPNGIFLDVNGDYRVTALDALEIINELNRLQLAQFESEQSVAPDPRDVALLGFLDEDDDDAGSLGLLF